MNENANQQPEEAVDVIEADATTSACPIAEYRQTDAALAILAERYAGRVYDVTTTAGMKEATQARRTLRTYRTDLEKARKALKEPLLEQGRVIDAEAKRITAALESLETPIDEQIKAEEARREAEKEAKAAAERERLRVNMNKVATLQNAWTGWAYRPSVEILAERDRLATLVPDVDEDFRPSADEAIAQSCAKLLELAEAATQREAAEAAEKARREAEAAELERQRAELAEQKRLADQAAAEARAKAEAEARALAEQKAAHERQMAEERAKAEAERAEADRAAQAERERQAAEQRQRLEAEAAARRAELEAEQKRLDAIRAEQEAKERAEREAREAAERQEREAREAAERAKLERINALIAPAAIDSLLQRVLLEIRMNSPLVREIHDTVNALRGVA